MQAAITIKNSISSVFQLIETSWRTRLFLLVFLIVYTVGGAIVALNKMDVSGDEHSYIPLGFNLYKYGVIAWSGSADKLEPGVSASQMDDGNVITPSQRRGPVYLALLAASLHLHPDSQNVSLQCFQGKAAGCESFRQDLKIVNIVLLALTVLIAYAATKAFSKSAVAGLTAAFLVASSKSLIDMSDTLRPEILATLLFFLASVMLVLVWLGPNLKNCLATGIVFAALALCQPIYLYSLCVPILVTVASVVRHKLSVRKLGLGYSMAILFAFALVTAPWLIRNQMYFGNSQVTSGGEIVLRVRAEYNQMTANEYLASFVFWTAAGRERLAGLIFEYDDYKRLKRDNYEDGYYKSARARASAIAHEVGADVTETRQLVVAEAKRMILDAPFKHLLVSIPVAWRGLFAETGVVLHARPFEFSGFLIRLTLNFAYWAGILFCIVSSIRTRQFHCLVFASLTIWAWLAYAGLSHYVPRYSYPFIPILAVLSVSVFSAKFLRKPLQESSLRQSGLIRFATFCGLLK